MAEKSAEVVVCGTSIMKDVWEIRSREYGQRLRLEQERIRRSALERINQDWQARMSYKIKTPKRLERKAKPLEEDTFEKKHVPVKKVSLARPAGFQSSRTQRHSDVTKTTKSNKLALLRNINERCPGLMVWSKSWKFSQPLPNSEGKETPSDWGKSWKFLNLQPRIEGKTWSDLQFDTNNNNMSTDGILFVKEWFQYGLASDSKHLEQDIQTSEWEKSWVLNQKKKESHGGTTNGPKTSYDCWTSINQWSQDNSASEWQESWKSTKQVQKGNAMSDTLQKGNEGTSHDEELNWNESWMYFNKEVNMKSRGAKTFNISEWGESWSLSRVPSGLEKKQNQAQDAMSSQKPKHPGAFCVSMNVSREMKQPIITNSQIQPVDWQKSWVVIKNMSEYREDTQLKKSTDGSNQMAAPKQHYNLPNEGDHLKFDCIALPKSKKMQELVHFSQQNDWKDSWKILKNQHRQERALRNQRCPPQPLPAPSTTLTEWSNSWRFTNTTLNQDSGFWDQGWSARVLLQPRHYRRTVENEARNENFPYNGPAGLRGWGDSWRYIRRQQMTRVPVQTGHRHIFLRSVDDWEQSWQTSSNQRPHDRASVTEWKDSWRVTSLDHENPENLQPEHTWFEKSMEIGDKKELYRASSRLTEYQKNQPVSKEWNECWRIKKDSKVSQSGLESPTTTDTLDWGDSWMSSSTEFYHKQGGEYFNIRLSGGIDAETEDPSLWGFSWKIANPQPPKNRSSWLTAKAKSFSARDAFWHKHKQSFNAPSSCDKLKKWGKSWRFVKIDIDSKQDKGSGENESVTSTKRANAHLYVNIDKLKPQEKKWSDACKLAKSQPRAKRNISRKPEKKEDRDNGMMAEWMESWKFSNSQKSRDLEQVSVSLKDWMNSWKFLLDPHTPVNGPKTGKAR